MRVLLVDDDAAYLSGCAAILTNDGHDVVTSLDLNEGRRRLAEDDFDALITDVRLGAYNGLHLIALASPSMIKIALSAFPDPVIRRDAEQAGAQFVVKPTDCAAVSALLPRTDHASP
jgi:DNA-binding response OmpR family regulator